MNLIISLSKEDDLNRIRHLKGFLENKDIPDLSEVNINRKQPEPGEMGDGGLFSSITAVISAATEPLTELIKCLQIYIQSFHTEIEVTVNDKSVKISGKNPEEVKGLVKDILKSI